MANLLFEHPSLLLIAKAGAEDAESRGHPSHYNDHTWYAVLRDQQDFDDLLFELGDHTPPAPPELDSVDSPTTSLSVTISGNTDPGAVVEITGGASSGQTIADATGRFAMSISLTPNATNTIEAAAADAAGNTSTPSGVQIQQIPLAAKILSPIDGAVVVKTPTPVEVSAQSDDAIASVTINGVAATLQSDENWLAQVPLTVGDNSVSAVVRDSQGNQIATSPITITYAQAEAAGARSFRSSKSAIPM